MKFARSFLCAVLPAAVLLAAQPAMAGASADFSGCDGLKKPKSKDDGMRGEATLPSFGGKSSVAIVASCTAALERNELKAHQNLRRAHLLRSRAAAYLSMEKAQEALDDLDAAERELGDYRGEFFFDRSMGVSLDLLRAIAYSSTGRDAEALQLAKKAEETRPFALQVQMTSTLLRDLHGATQLPKSQVWQRLGQISPASRGAAELRVALEGSPEDAVKALSAQIGEQRPAYSPGPDMRAAFGSGDITPALSAWVESYARGASEAYARAATGHHDEARERIADLESAVTLVVADVPKDGEPPKGFVTFAAPLMKEYSSQFLDPAKALVMARIAISEGRSAEVAAILEGMQIRENLQANELYAAYDKERLAGASALPELPPLRPAATPSAFDLTALPGTLLIRPENPRTLIDYKKSRPDVLGGLVSGVLSMGISLLGGFDRTKGFQSEVLDNGLVKVEYNGQTTSAPMVQEMTLLRAAEIAREKGHSKFLVSSRKDYGVYWGTSWERTLTGYKTVFEIALLKDDTTAPYALDSVAIIDALGPIYYEDGA